MKKAHRLCKECKKELHWTKFNRNRYGLLHTCKKCMYILNSNRRKPKVKKETKIEKVQESNREIFLEMAIALSKIAYHMEELKNHFCANQEIACYPGLKIDSVEAKKFEETFYKENTEVV